MNGPAFWNKLLGDVRTAYRTRGTVAGGAIRDWMLGVQPNDIDIFLPDSFNKFEDEHPDGWVYRRSLGREEYPGATEGFNVNEYLVDDTVVQVMFLEHGFHTHYGLFDNNLTKGYYDPTAEFMTGRLVLSDDLLYGLERQRIYAMGDVTNHIQQRMERQRVRLNETLPGWQVIDNPYRPAVPAVQPQGIIDQLLARANPLDAVQVRPQPVRVVGDEFGVAI